MPELRPDQFEARRSRIGASEVGALLGPHPWTSPAQIYARIHDGPDPAKTSPSMAAGHALESAIAHYAAADLGLDMIHACWRTYVHDVLPLAATPDYWIRTRQDGPGLLEVKLSRDWSDWLDGPPPWYAWQVRAQLALTNRRWAILAALVGSAVQVHRIDRDRILEDQMYQAVADFERRHLEPGIPPPTEDERLILRWRLEPGQTIAQGDLESTGDAYAQVVRGRRQAEGVEAVTRAAFVALLPGNTRLVLGHGWSAKVDDRGVLRFDVKARPGG